MLDVKEGALSAYLEDLKEKHAGAPVPDELIVELFEMVRELPYGTIGSRSAEDVWRIRRGTCSGKHVLLRKLFEAVGVEVSERIVMHAFNDLPVEFPKPIRELLSIEDILDPHNILRIMRPNGWKDVDATWDSPLQKVGFPVNQGWDGRTSMPVCVVERSRLETTDSIALKKELLGQMTEQSRELRTQFLYALTAWLDDVRCE